MITFDQIHIHAFGGLKDKTVTLSPSLHIQQGDNESGKSTTLAFLRWVLYGFPSPADKKLQKPLDGEAPSGSLTLTKDGETMVVHRLTPTSGKDKVQLLSSDGTPILPEGTEPGEYLFGISREIFDQTAMIRQGDGGAVDGKKLSAAMNNILTAANEDISVEKAIALLDQARVALYYINKKGGRIAEEEAEISRLRASLQEARASGEETAQTEGLLADKTKTLAAHTKRKETYEALMLAYRVQKRKEKEELLRSRLARKCEAEAAFAEVKEQGIGNGLVPNEDFTAAIREASGAVGEKERALNEAQRALVLAAALNEDGADREFALRGGSEAVIADCRGHLERSKRYRLWGILLLVLVIGIVFLVLSAAEKKKAGDLLAVFGCESLEALEALAAARAARVRHADRQRASAEAQAKQASADLAEAKAALNALCAQAGLTPEEMALALPRYEQTLLRARAEAREANAAYLSTKELLESEEAPGPIPDSLPDLPEGFDPVDTARKHKFYAEQIPLLQKQIHALQIKLTELRATHADPAALADAIGEKKKQLAAMREDYAAIALAMETLESASRSMRDNVTGGLSAMAAGYLREMTGGRYDTLGVDDSFAIHTPHPDRGGMAVTAAFLSEGTRNQAYLALRMALSRLLCPGDMPPLLLDEALVYLDDTRLAGVLALFEKEARQVIVFTASSREKRILGMA